MRTAGVAKLKASLSEYLRYVKEGGEVLVTERGRPIAKIVPYTLEGDEDQHRLDLIRRGLLKPGKGKMDVEFFKRPKVKDPEGLALRYLLEERESGL